MIKAEKDPIHHGNITMKRMSGYQIHAPLKYTVGKPWNVDVPCKTEDNKTINYEKKNFIQLACRQGEVQAFTKDK